MNSPFISDWVLTHAERTPEAPAVATPDVRLSYGELADRVRRLAEALAASGVVPGERVLVALPNLAATAVVELALHALGACVVKTNRASGPDALGTIVARTGVRRAFMLDRDAAAWAEIARSHALELWLVSERDRGAETTPVDAIVARIAADGRLETDLGARAIPRSPDVRPEDPALILYTSGSTGKPHGVVQTWRNVDANTRSIVRYLGLTSADRAMLILPLSYCYGRSVLQSHLFVGGSVFFDNRFMFPRVVLETLRQEGCTGFAGVPATFELIRRQVDVRSLGPFRLRYLTQAGDAMSPDTIRWVRRAFRPAVLFVMYGQTEATARLSYLPPELADEKEGSIGIPIPGVELKVVDDSGREVADAEVGNLIAKGDNVTPGYYGEPEESAAILRGGWLWTGDLAWRDRDGFLFHAGRSKEILKIAGHRVSPAEIEHTLARHPDVADVAVVGGAGEIQGEVAVAFVVRRQGCDVSETRLRRFCSELLPSFKVPATIRFVDALPRNEAGKLARTRLSL